MNSIKEKLANDVFLVRVGIILFVVNIGIAYMLYPHWVTFSHLAMQAFTLPFFLAAMLVTIFLIVHTGKKLRAQELHVAGVAFYMSAICAAFVVLIPYSGSGAQIALHNFAALLFVLFAAGGLAWLAVKLRDALLGLAATLQVVICGIELYLLAIFDTHPVQPWVWVVLQVSVTLVLLVVLLRIFAVLEKMK